MHINDLLSVDHLLWLALLAGCVAYGYLLRGDRIKERRLNQEHNDALTELLKSRGRYMWYLQRRLGKAGLPYVSEIEYSESLEGIPPGILSIIDNGPLPEGL